jgi:epoxyqueuosine reductase
VAGCDICQEVCPWNQRPLPSSNDADLQPRSWLLELDGDEALGWSDTTWEERLRASALRRIRPTMWRRNIRAAMGRQGTGP